MFVENGAPITDIYEGQITSGEVFQGLSTEAKRTYTILLAILPNGELLEVVWIRRPCGNSRIRDSFGETWLDYLDIRNTSQKGAIQSIILWRSITVRSN